MRYVANVMLDLGKLTWIICLRCYLLEESHVTPAMVRNVEILLDQAIHKQVHMMGDNKEISAIKTFCEIKPLYYT